MTVDYNPFNSPDFRKELSELFDEKLGPLAAKVDKHEAAFNKGKGLAAAFAVLWTGALALAEYILHRR